MAIRTNRRQAIKMGGIIGLALATGLPANAAKPKRGGTFRVAKGHGSTADTLDPSKFDNGFMLANAYNYGNFLTEIDAENNVLPELAESWEASDDAKTWTFRLRRGVKFHDGRELTSRDVVASIDHHRGPDSTSSGAPIVAPIQDVIAVDDHTVIFEIESGDADFPFILAAYQLIILPAKDDGTIDWESGIGTGPYKIEEFEPGVRASYVRNEDYFKPDRGWFDRIEMLSILDSTARVNALITGEIDAMDKIPLEVAARIASAPGVVLQEAAGNQHYTFAMHTNVAPFDDNNVRQALKYGIDRQELVDKVLQGYGVVGNDHPISPSQRFYNSEMEQSSYDPVRAREYLEKAGLERLAVDLYVADAAFDGAIDAGLLYAEKARDAGIDINVVRAPDDGYWSDVWLKKPFSAVYWNGRPTEDGAFSIAYAAGGAWNDTFWDNERFNELLVAARSELDPDKRRAMYYEMQEILANEGGTIIPMFASYVFAHSDKIAHDKIAANQDMDGERWGERWWFDS